MAAEKRSMGRVLMILSGAPQGASSSETVFFFCGGVEGVFSDDENFMVLVCTGIWWLLCVRGFSFLVGSGNCGNLWSEGCTREDFKFFLF